MGTSQSLAARSVSKCGAYPTLSYDSNLSKNGPQYPISQQDGSAPHESLGTLVQPMCRRPSTMLVREAWYAGIRALINPTKAATHRAKSAIGAVTFIDAGKPGRGDLPTRYISAPPSSTPATPPSTARVTDSAR